MAGKQNTGASDLIAGLIVLALIVWAVNACGDVLGIGDDDEDGAEQERIEQRQEDTAEQRRAEARRIEARQQQRARRQRERIQAVRKRERQQEAAQPAPAPESSEPAASCESGYDPCVPPFPPDVNCDQVGGPINVTGSDPHELDADGDRIACE